LKAFVEVEEGKEGQIKSKLSMMGDNSKKLVTLKEMAEQALESIKTQSPVTTTEKEVVSPLIQSYLQRMALPQPHYTK
jgi:hypothetical protein